MRDRRSPDGIASSPTGRLTATRERGGMERIMSDFHRGFETIDRSPDQQSFFQFLDLAGRFPSIIRYRDRMLELCPIADGSVVLDVGCGIGNEATRIASRVGNTGRIYGVDSSEVIIEEARRRVGRLELPLEFQVGDAHSLTFEGSSFDICRAERVLLYLEDPAKAVAENGAGHATRWSPHRL
jgi:ubiquinone/menaquinone biosynthesis C-methylase UbiE